jgi:hypothetical protein
MAWYRYRTNQEICLQPPINVAVSLYETFIGAGCSIILYNQIFRPLALRKPFLPKLVFNKQLLRFACATLAEMLWTLLNMVLWLLGSPHVFVAIIRVIVDENQFSHKFLLVATYGALLFLTGAVKFLYANCR